MSNNSTPVQSHVVVAACVVVGACVGACVVAACVVVGACVGACVVVGALPQLLQLTHL